MHCLSYVGIIDLEDIQAMLSNCILQMVHIEGTVRSRRMIEYDVVDGVLFK